MTAETATAKLYHGGQPGLKPGDFILPPSETDADSLANYGNYKCSLDRVYLTTNLKAAIIYAAAHPSRKGMVYLVSPEGPLEDDPDCKEPGFSYACPKARILSRRKLSNRTRKRVLRALAS